MSELIKRKIKPGPTFELEYQETEKPTSVTKSTKTTKKGKKNGTKNAS